MNDDTERIDLTDTQPIPLQLATVPPTSARARHARTRPTQLVEAGSVATAGRWGGRTLLGLTLVVAALLGTGIGLAAPQPGPAEGATLVPTTVVTPAAEETTVTNRPTTTTPPTTPAAMRSPRRLDPTAGATPAGEQDREPPQPTPQPERTRTAPVEAEEPGAKTPPVTGTGPSTPTTPPTSTSMHRPPPTDGAG